MLSSAAKSNKNVAPAIYAESSLISDRLSRSMLRFSQLVSALNRQPWHAAPKPEKSSFAIGVGAVEQIGSFPHTEIRSSPR